MSRANEFLVMKLRQISYHYDDVQDRNRAMAFARAADSIQTCSIKISSGKAATKLSGVGPSIAATIDELLRTGTSRRLK